ncbi:hypothetical protein B9Y85_08930 [Stenotrophomonas maltophilia]|uniref:Uncharacterized protein n=1 Tax=Stenotrophomonas maltophilia TaxID=40324 RepID=A0A2J0T563_STEMA|nr:hypothetical protein [Stenotrophomonas maltophilia]PJL05675.1 hypothetical protein B9Y57_01310 [Stenotrophomonas maltophilia]PJL32739.1 hypothetical protein B9Y65_01310 [Stenotrophomonas maltophilia]PJL67901.1 hypothetical protein B9Y85_08930 [Stenotrophomonas maltophilia]
MGKLCCWERSWWYGPADRFCQQIRLSVDSSVGRVDCQSTALPSACLKPRAARDSRLTVDSTPPPAPRFPLLLWL